jgi:hypothetical protein
MTDDTKIPFPTAKVMKGMEIVGYWQKHIRALVDGTVETELRCAAYAAKYKRDPKYFSDIYTDEITSIVEYVVYAIEQMANSYFPQNQLEHQA